MLPRYREMGYEVLGISTDSIEHNSKFAAEHNFMYPLLCDTSGEVVSAFGACKSKAMHPDPQGLRHSACRSAARVTVVLDPTGKITHYDHAFDARTGPESLLSKISIVGNFAESTL